MATGSPQGALGGLALKSFNDLLEGLGLSDEDKEKVRQAVPGGAPAPAPTPQAPQGAQGGAPAPADRSFLDSTIDKLVNMHESLIQTIEGNSKSGGNFVTNLVVDGEKMADATYEFIRESLDSEFKLVEK